MAKGKKRSTHFGTGPISKKLVSSAQQLLQRRVINISEWREAKIKAEDFDKTIISHGDLSKFDPLHGAYVYGQNKISVFVEQLAELPTLSELTNVLADAQEEYMPSGPPISPLTASYFTCWGFFDLCAGVKRESFGTVIIDLCKFFDVDKGLISVFEKMQNSRMGFYVHEGRSGKYVLLRELITNRNIKAIVPSGYKGHQGEIWFARIMPPPFDIEQYEYYVVFTTPYIVGELKTKHSFSKATERDWLLYFERNLTNTGLNEKKSAYEFLMKYGLGQQYWNEYVFLAYVNHQQDMIILSGFPDIPSSLPHSGEGEKRLGF